MALIAKETGSEFPLVPAATHIARCVWVIDLGTQENTLFASVSRKVMIGWELPEETITKEGKQLPMMISKEYTLSLSEKANLRHDLESWRGKEFTPEELKGFDIAAVLGKEALLSVVHAKSSKGKEYAKVNSVAKLAKNMKCEPQVHPALAYEIGMGKNDVFNSLPEWIQKKIANSEESKQPAVAPETPPADDDVPF